MIVSWHSLQMTWFCCSSDLLNPNHLQINEPVLFFLLTRSSSDGLIVVAVFSSMSGELFEHLPEIRSFLLKPDNWQQDSGSASTSIKSSISPAYLRNTTQYIPSALEQQPQRPDEVSQTTQSESSAVGLHKHIALTSVTISVTSIKPKPTSALPNLRES